MLQINMILFSFSTWVGGQSARCFGEATGTPHGCTLSTRSAMGGLTQLCPTALNVVLRRHGHSHAGEMCGSLLFLNVTEEQFPFLHKVQFSRLSRSAKSQLATSGSPTDTFQWRNILSNVILSTPRPFVHRIGEKKLSLQLFSVKKYFLLSWASKIAACLDQKSNKNCLWADCENADFWVE